MLDVVRSQLDGAHSTLDARSADLKRQNRKRVGGQSHGRMGGPEGCTQGAGAFGLASSREMRYIADIFGFVSES